MGQLLHDIRYGLRQLRKAPVFTLTAVLTLALGVGANTAVFTLVNAVMLQSLPVADPSRLYRVGDNDNCCVWGGFQNDWGLFAYPLYEQLRDHTPAFQQLAAMQSWGYVDIGVRLAEGNQAAENYGGEWVSGNYFSTLGVRAFLGRTLTPADDTAGAPPAAVMSYHTWEQRFGGNPKLVGASLTINGKPFTLVGVAAPGFFGDRVQSNPADFWLPLAQEPMLQGNRSLLRDPNENWLYLIGRMAPDAQPKAVEAQLNVELRQWLTAVPRLDSDQRSRINKQSIRLGPGGGGIANLKEYYKQALYMLIVASALVLLIACANLANLLLTRATVRRQQISIQMALGASRARLVRSLITESVVLAVLGGAAGLLFAYAGARAMLLVVFQGARFVPISAAPSLPILAFTLAVSVITGILFGVVPAWLVSRSNPAEALRGAGRSTRDHSALPQKLLVITQAALSLVLLAAAGLVGQSLRNLQSSRYGFQTQNRYVAFINPELAGYTPDTLPALSDELQRRMMQLPGALSSSLSMYIPQGHDNWSEGVFVAGHPVEPGHEPGASWTRVSPGYFQSIGTPVLRGRAITEQDTAASAKVAVINEAFAKKIFPNEDPIGKRFGRSESTHAADYEVVGIVADAKYQNPSNPVRPMFFLPLAQTIQFSDSSNIVTETRSLFFRTMVMHVAGSPPGMEQQVRGMLAAINPNLVLLGFRTYDDQVSSSFSQQRLLSGLTGLFSLLALLLASVGLYGVTAYRVARRTSEIGIRMALGANPGNVLLMVLRGALSQVGLGLLAGIPLTLVAGRLLASKLFGVGSYDPRVLGAAVAVLALCAVIASLVPARRPAGVHPMEALRTE